MHFRRVICSNYICFHYAHLFPLSGSFSSCSGGVGSAPVLMDFCVFNTLTDKIRLGVDSHTSPRGGLAESRGLLLLLPLCLLLLHFLLYSLSLKKDRRRVEWWATLSLTLCPTSTLLLCGCIQLYPTQWCHCRGCKG